jgi:hypothetical protein
MDGGWELDKFKFVNMVVRAWELRPDQDWYVFAEADTYVVWPTLVHWLRNKVNPRDNVYVGSVAMIAGFPFAHGGSGYVVSGALMRKMAQIPDITKYDEKAGEECCGDVVFARVAKEVGTKVMNAHPMFNGEKPNTLPYGPGHWCEPLLTMHHMNSEEISAVWQYQQTRTKKVGGLFAPTISARFTLTRVCVPGLYANSRNVLRFLRSQNGRLPKGLGQPVRRHLLHCSG